MTPATAAAGWRQQTITRENGNLYGKTYLNPKTEKARTRNAQQRPKHKYQITESRNDVRYRQMLSNGRVHDTDGFLFDGENTLQHLKVKKAGAASLPRLTLPY